MRRIILGVVLVVMAAGGWYLYAWRSSVDCAERGGVLVLRADRPGVACVKTQ